MASPLWEPDLAVGCIATVKVGLRRKKAVIASATSDAVEVLIEGRRLAIRPSKVLSVESSSLPECPAYRVASHGEVESGLALLTDTGRRRAFALATLHADNARHLAQSGLSAHEIGWLSMWAAHDRDDRSSAVRLALALPRGRYRDKLVVIAASWRWWRANEAVTKDVQAELASWAGEPLADVMRYELGDEDDVHRVELAAAALADVDLPGLGWAQESLALRAVGTGLRTDEALDSVASRSSYARVLMQLAHRRVDVAVPTDVLVDLDRSLLDSLIDAGAVGAEIVDNLPAHTTVDVANYLAARLSPSRLTDHDLEAVGHQGELARRRFLQGTVSVPSDDQQHCRFVLLDRLRGGDPRVVADLVPLLPSDQHRCAARALGRSLRTGVIERDALADRSTWPTLEPLVPLQGPARSSDLLMRSFEEQTSLRRALQSLYEWDWPRAATAARACLRVATSEDVRDEALNTLACALWHQGNDDGATKALAEALEGVDSPALIVNFGIVAERSDRAAAAIALAGLATDASPLELRVTAARRAVMLWSSSAVYDNDDKFIPPSELIVALRLLTVEPVSLDEHVQVIQFLSWADAEWLAEPRHTAASPNYQTVEHRYFVARAKGPKAVAAELAGLLRQQPANEFLLRQRDLLTQTLVRGMLDSNEPHLGLASWALDMIDAGVPLGAREEVLLPVLAVRALLWSMPDGENAEPCTLKTELFERLQVANNKLTEYTEDDRVSLRMLLNTAFNHWAAANWAGWHAELRGLAKTHDEIVRRLPVYPYQVNRAAVRSVTGPIVTRLKAFDTELRRVRSSVTATEAREDLDRLLAFCADLTRAFVALPR